MTYFKIPARLSRKMPPKKKISSAKDGRMEVRCGASPPQRNKGSGERCELVNFPAGFGMEPRSQTLFGQFWRILKVTERSVLHLGLYADFLSSSNSVFCHILCGQGRGRNIEPSVRSIPCGPLAVKLFAWYAPWWYDSGLSCLSFTLVTKTYGVF